LTIEASTLADLGDFQRCVVVGIDETLPIINKQKHLKKGGIQGSKWKDSHPRRQKNHLKRVNHKPNPLLVARNISNE
jgi:hypothetical protein